MLLTTAMYCMHITSHRFTVLHAAHLTAMYCMLLTVLHAAHLTAMYCMLLTAMYCMLPTRRCC